MRRIGKAGGARGQTEPVAVALGAGGGAERGVRFGNFDGKEAHFLDAFEGFRLIGDLYRAAGFPALGVNGGIRIGGHICSLAPWLIIQTYELLQA